MPKVENPGAAEPANVVPAQDSYLQESKDSGMIPTKSAPKWLRNFGWQLISYTLLAIMWGAFVRASGSGDGCGPNWPSCKGGFSPSGHPVATWIEFIHRASTGILLPLILFQGFFVAKYFKPGSLARKVALGSIFFMITEALVGAVLVKTGLVAGNESLNRAYIMSTHLINTLIMLGFMAATAWLMAGGKEFQWKRQGAVGSALRYCLVGVLIMGVSGAIAALGDTLYPAANFQAGLQRELSGTAPALLALRLWHPVVALSLSAMALLMVRFIAKERNRADITRYSKIFSGFLIFELLFGLSNVLANAPIWMQLVHLLIADGVWLSLLLLTFSALDKEYAEPITESDEVMQDAPVPMYKAYISLTKPRVISLLLFTTMVAMFIAKGGWPGGWLFLAVLVGGYAAAGSANAINMVYDRDIDVKMARTAKRPTVTAQISSQNALIFAAVLMTVSFTLLTFVGNLLSALMALSGLLFYVFIYTMGLKRRTPQNIVIGGAAGAFPPLVGYAAVTNTLPALAWVLFAIIFFWTPVHFWALALLIKDDYKDAGIPMLPVIKGDRVTVNQIG
ncbi:MAG: heme o synthase, partial [Armatimonadetes bacterium]|nr:heme o synthase [Armatimonadota bacterium]